MGRTRLLLAVFISAIVIAGSFSSLRAQPYYEGKTIRILLSTGLGGGYAAYARLLMQHMGRHIAGSPNFVLQNMPGAGGLTATNFLFAQAPQDGTTLGVIHAAVPLMPLFGDKAARFDPLKFNWIGSLDKSDGMCTVWSTSPIQSWQDTFEKEYIVGSLGAGVEVYPLLLKRLFEPRIKIVSGYKDGSSIFLAMENGEIHGQCRPQLTAITSIRPHWLTEKKFRVILLIGHKRNPDFPDAPTVFELAKDERSRQQLNLLVVSQDMDRPVLLPPNVPDERVREIRAAFEATVKDPAFLADARKQNLTINPVSGVEIADALKAAYQTPQEIVDEVADLMRPR